VILNLASNVPVKIVVVNDELEEKVNKMKFDESCV